MMTMTTSTVDFTSSQCSDNQLTIDKPSFSVKELTDANSQDHCCDNECYHSLHVLHTVPTSNATETATNATAESFDGDNDLNPHENVWEDFSTFLQDWEDFCKEFTQLTTYALAHSSTNTPLPFDDDNDDRAMSDSSEQQKTTNNSFDESLRQLCHSVRALEKVNHQLAQQIASLENHDTWQPTLQHPVIIPQQPKPCPAPQHDHNPQYILPIEPPPAPNPQACPSLACQPTPLTKQSPRPSGTLPLLDHPAPNTVPSAFTSTPPNSKPTILNWARPAIPPPASSRPMTGVFCAVKSHWPPPQPERKTIPFKKQPQTKPTATNHKDFLHPP